jgi:hypothetical protein
LVIAGIMVMASMTSSLQMALLWSSMPNEGVPTLPQVLMWIPVVAAVAVGVWLIRWRHALAARWFHDSESAIDSDPRTLLRLGLLVIGIVLIARGIPALISGVTSGVVTEWGGLDNGIGTHITWIWTRALTSSAGPVVELVVGALVLAYATRLADRLWGPRGRPDPDDASA